MKRRFSMFACGKPLKQSFKIDEVINMTDNVYYVTVDDESLCDSLGVTRQDVADLCDLREIGFENIRWVKDLFTEFGGCWIVEKIDVERDGDKHGGMLVCLSVRVGRMLDEYCKDNVEVQDRARVEDLMYELNAALDDWNGDNKKKVNRIILLLESLRDVFSEIREKQLER